MSVGDFLSTPIGKVVVCTAIFGGGLGGGRYITASQFEDSIEQTKRETEKLIIKANAEGIQNGRLQSLEAVASDLLDDVKDLGKTIDTLNRANDQQDRRLDQHDSRLGNLERYRQ